MKKRGLIMKFAERLVPIVFIIFCLIYFPQTFSFSPDWRSYPQVLIAILFILCVFWLMIDIYYRKSIKNNKSNIIFSRVIITTMLTLIYILTLNIVGFYVMTLIFIPTLMFFLGVSNIRLLIGVSISSVIILYILFSTFLGVSTPRGLLF